VKIFIPDLTDDWIADCLRDHSSTDISAYVAALPRIWMTTIRDGMSPNAA
jgi:hypothetical protein